MFQKTKVCTGLMLAFGGMGFALPGMAQQESQQLQRVEITGSAIKRVDSEGPAPVEVYSRKDIQRTGATSISELMKSIASIDIDDQGELTGNSPTGSGSANLRIRGLSERNLLVLLNGRRLPVAALQDGSGAGAAVDVNNIPLSAIERVEILKDGGSAIYGADAVAGVINFITKKNYTGFEVRGSYGQSSRGDAKEKTGGLVFGLGDYDTSGFNVLAALDVFKRDPLPRSARDITSSADWRRFDNGNGFDGRSTFDPSGNIVAGPGAPGQVRTCAPTDLKGGLCRFDFSKTILTSINGADRTSGMLIGSLKVAKDTRLYGELILSESKDELEAQPAPFAYDDPVTGNTYRYRSLQFGPRTTNRKSSLVNFVVGADGSWRNIDWDVAAGQGTNKTTNSDSNYAATDLTYARLADGTFDPTVTTNPQSVIDSIKIYPHREGKSVIRFLNAKASGPIMELGDGPLQYAVGVSLNHESLADLPDANQIAGNVLGSIAQSAVDARRDFRAVFGELSIPLFKGFEGQIAVRYDQYANLHAMMAGVAQSFPGQSRTSPKIAAKYQPLSNLLFRASYAESFLAPSLKQLFGGQDEGSNSTSDPNICAAFPTLSGTCDNFPYKQLTGSNPLLKPEIGKTLNLGFVFEPAKNVSFGLDFWQIKKRDEISQPTVESAVAAGAIGIKNGEAQVFTNNQNLSQTRVQGYDADIRIRLGDTPLGKASIRNSFTYYTHIQNRPDNASPLDEYVGTFLTPRWRNMITFNFETGPWASTVAVHTTSSMVDSNLAAGSFPASTRNISIHDELDVAVQYTGVKNLTLNAGIKNLFDHMPPYSNMGAQNQYGSLGFPWSYSPRGRFLYFGATYAFK